jgi:hypothetical protein
LVLLGNLVGLVRVATVAGVLHIIARMADTAGDLALPAMIQREAVQA